MYEDYKSESMRGFNPNVSIILHNKEYREAEIRSEKSRKEINKIADEAKAHGMSYGKYVSMLYMEEQRKKEREKRTGGD